MSSLSLMSIIREDPDFGRRISKKVEEIKQDKQNLLHLADDYGQRYQDEILEGTEKRANLLTEGKSRGLTEDEIEILFQSASDADEEVHIRFARAIESKMKERNDHGI